MSYQPVVDPNGNYPPPPPHQQQQQQQQPYSASTPSHQQQQYYVPQAYYQQQQTPISPQTQSYSNFAPPAADQYSKQQQQQQQEPSSRQGGALRRAVTKMVQKEVTLSDDGALILEYPVSKHILEGVDRTDDKEFTHLRYTAVTCDPNQFKDKYKLRISNFGRRIRIAVVVTMYNEDDELFSKTFTALMKNIAYLCSGRCAGWTKDDWKEIVVCIVSDGRAKCNPLTLNVMSVMGLYMDGLAKASINGQAVTGHIFEFTVQNTVGRNLMIRKQHDSTHDRLTLVPVQCIFVLKEKNAKKINSHRWFFKAICDSILPDITVLIDCGTKPTKESFWHLYKAFDRNPNVAGACGEIAAELGHFWKNLVNPIIAVQNFEYKMSNILDKPLESVFGYISVLPGAFSAYRYEALQGAPLACYFKGENPHGRNVSEANMYLAEDRILCFELTMKKERQYVLKYVKSARAETDVPSDWADLIKQRRRWLNGSFFASLHACLNVKRIFESGHTGSRKTALFVQFIYNVVTLLFSWFNLGNFYLAFYYLFDIHTSSQTAQCDEGTLDTTSDPFYPHGGIVSGVLGAIYLASLVSMIIASMGNRPEAAKIVYILIAVVFACIMFMMLFLAAWTIRLDILQFQNQSTPLIQYVFQTPSFRDLVVSTLSTYGLYLLGSLLHLDPWHCFTCMIQYLLMLPSFINIIMVYAFCNIHDVSWGTKGIDSATPLADVVTKKTADGKEVVTVEFADAKDVDTIWQESHKELMKEAAGLKDRKGDGPTKTVDDDFFKQFRTNVVLLWFFSNGLLVYLWTSPQFIMAVFPNGYAKDGSVFNPYFTFLLWSVAVLSATRFIASTVYLVQWWFEAIDDSGKRNIVRSLRDEIGKDFEKN